MTSLLRGAKRLVSGGTDVGARLEGLAQAARAARGRLDDGLVDDTEALVTRAHGRLKLSADHTIVALAGATGSGKSSTFNALAGIDLSAVGVRRPTTSWATACVWGDEGAEELLEWLGIAPRHQSMRNSLLDTSRQDKAMSGVVLLDLPDHDSTEISHHLEVDRLVQLADLLVWVLDPQKYADAAIHDRYLAPLATHREVMVVALNHIDEVAPERRESMLADVRRLVAADGLAGVPVLPVSARTGLGVPELRAEIVKRVAAKKATRARLEADVKAVAGRMSEATGTAAARTVSRERSSALDDALAEAAGVPTVVRAVQTATRRRANRATGWPVTSWLSRLRPDPLRRLHLDLGSAGQQLTGRARTSVPAASPVQRARVDTEVRALADQVGEGLARPWAHAVRRASVAQLDELGDRLDQAVGGTRLGAERPPVWARGVRVVQRLLLAAAVTGLLWLGALFVLGYLQMPEPSLPRVAGLPVPFLLLVGGVLVGLLLALACRGLVSLTARSRGRAADRRLRAAVAEVARELVLEPIGAELASYATVREGLDRALR